MGPAGGQSNKSNNNNGIRAISLLERHPVKLLNLSLLIYLALGGFLFDFLGEFQEPGATIVKLQQHATDSQIASNRVNKDDDNREPHVTKSLQPEANLRELRLNSVRRMWNITNQLNILYESNWTKLVLDELLEFERRFVDSLAADSNFEPLESREGKEEEGRKDEDERTRDKKNREEKTGREKKKLASRSIKKSLIHSLATITTIGSPLGSPKSESGKLVTILYGLVGIPLVFCTVASTGAQLARKTTNSLLVLSHYCLSLPLYYLRRSCFCFRLLSWCCCCCCCSYLCCCNRKSNDKRRAADGGRQDKRWTRPKLRLLPPEVRGSRRRRQRRPDKVQRAYVIGGADTSGQQLRKTSDHHLQKSVRFSNQRKSSDLMSRAREFELKESEQLGPGSEPQIEEIEENSVYSSSLFIASLSILSLYLSLGAFFYSRSQNLTIIEALFVCYDLVSASRLPDSLGQLSLHKTESPPSIRSIYKTLKNANSTTHNNNTITSVSKSLIKQSDQVELPVDGELALVLQSLYLLCGLNLVSMCAHFGRMWLSHSFSGDEYDDINKPSSDDAENNDDHHLTSTSTNFNQPNICNGFGPSSDPSMGTISHRFAGSSVQQPGNAQLPPEVTGGDQQFVLKSMANLNSISSQESANRQQQQIDLAELFVVGQQHVSPPLANCHYNSAAGSTISHHQLQQRPSSDQVSFTSDRSTIERGSLCQLHQAAGGGSSTSSAGTAAAIYGPQNALYGHHQRAPRSHHLYLQEEDGDADDDDAMSRMLKTCALNGQTTKSGSSLGIHLPPAQVSNGTGNSLCQQQAMDSFSGTLQTSGPRIQLQNHLSGCNGFGGDQLDSSLNTMDTTNSNTMSSSISSRTVKLPSPAQHFHIHNGIGFILDNDTLDHEQ